MQTNTLFRLIVGLVIAVSTFGVFALRAPTALACSCAVPGTPQESLNAADAVFAGEVIAIDPRRELSFQRSLPFVSLIRTTSRVRITFAVSEVWKGPNQQQSVVTTTGSEAACGYAFRTGETYIVYAFNQGGELSTNICTRTAVLAQAQDDIAAFGPGTAPASVDTARMPAGALLLLGGAGAIVGVIAVPLFVRKRRAAQAA